MEMIIKQEYKDEVNEILDFVESLSDAEQKEFLAFVQGAKFAQELGLTNEPPRAAS